MTDSSEGQVLSRATGPGPSSGLESRTPGFLRFPDEAPGRRTENDRDNPAVRAGEYRVEEHAEELEEKLSALGWAR